MELLYALLLGLVQGLTEFLPVSSSGHLLLVGRIIGYSPSIAFEIVAHLGTLGAVLIVYRKRVMDCFMHPLSKGSLVIVFTTAVTAVLVLFFEDFLRSTFGGSLLPYAFLMTAILLVASSFIKPKKVGAPGFFEGFIVGVSQAVAVIPGLSRSGTTISAARFTGIDKKESADFSFMLSIPIIVVSAASELLRHYDEFAGENVLCLIVGCIAAFLSGLLAIKLVLRCIQKGGFKIFAIYLVVLSVLLFINDFFLGFI